MKEQICNIINEQRVYHQHLVAVCSITGNEEEHSIHLLVLTDSEDPDNPTVLVDKDLDDVTIEEFMTELDTINEETIGGQVEAFIPNLWALFYGCDSNEMEGLKQILNDAFDDNDWSLNGKFGIGVRIEIK